MKPIVISGGQYPDNWKAIQDENEENFIRFDKAELLIVDWDTGSIINKVNYISPEEARNPSMMFKVCNVTDDAILVVTNSELLIYDKNSLEIIDAFSHPSFNDLHAVAEINNTYHVVNTGLEILQIFSKKGELLKEHNMATPATRERFSEHIDYRKIGSTKPHESHINNVFSIGDEIYVTRLVQKDAININDPGKAFKIEIGHPHDGLVRGDKVYFTTTDGHLVVFDSDSREKVDIIDLNRALENSGFKPGGWCRGALPLNESRILIGYTQLRHTKFKEFVFWTKNLGSKASPSRVIELDYMSKKVVKEFIYPGAKGFAIFSIQSL